MGGRCHKSKYLSYQMWLDIYTQVGSVDARLLLDRSSDVRCFERVPRVDSASTLSI